MASAERSGASHGSGMENRRSAAAVYALCVSTIGTLHAFLFPTKKNGTLQRRYHTVNIRRY